MVVSNTDLPKVIKRAPQIAPYLVLSRTGDDANVGAGGAGLPRGPGTVPKRGEDEAVEWLRIQTQARTFPYPSCLLVTYIK